MTLKITKQHDPITVDQIVVCVYGQPGVGKTTLGFTASKPLLLDFDKGAHRAAMRRDSVQVTAWSDVEGMDATDLEGYETVIVDTAGRALDALALDIIQKEPKMGRNGSLTLQGYGALKSRFIAWTKQLRSFGIDVVLIAHSDEQRDGDQLIERLDMQGASKNEVYKSADAMGRIYVHGNQTILNFSPSDAQFGKNPAQLEPLNVPNVDDQPDFLAGVIQSTKDSLNALTEEQQEVIGIMAEWKQNISGAEDLESVNKLVHKEKDPRVEKTLKGLIHKHALDLGLEPDPEHGQYKAKEEAA